ncbi:MAG TPA: hypothetical protein VM345_10425 [Acidimicrobiales bacterium]|jgi:hypothetical protein|nr:hypothetical protein [Acidimicrobiales bacterium]
MAESRMIEAYLTELRRSVDKLADADDIVDEAADHLYTAFDRLIASGLAAGDAEAHVVARFGSASLVAKVFAEEAKRGGAVSTTLTRRAGMTAMATVPLFIIGGIGNELVPAGRGPVHAAFVTMIVAGFAAFAVGLWGLRRRHGGLGRVGRVAFWWFVLSPGLALPAGYGALVVLVAEWLLIMSLLGVGMIRARVLPAAAVGLFTMSPVVALAIAGGATIAGIDAAEYFMVLLAPVALGFTWLGWAMSREPALDVRPGNQRGPIAMA